MAIRRALQGLTVAAALMAGVCLPTARAAGEDGRADAGSSIWAFTVLDYTAAGSGHAVQRLWYPTREACEAARQAVVEIGEEERPIPVVGRCLKAERLATRPSG